MRSGIPVSARRQTCANDGPVQATVTQFPPSTQDPRSVAEANLLLGRADSHKVRRLAAVGWFGGPARPFPIGAALTNNDTSHLPVSSLSTMARVPRHAPQLRGRSCTKRREYGISSADRGLSVAASAVPSRRRQCVLLRTACGFRTTAVML
jgi:hypothetical protein